MSTHEKVRIIDLYSDTKTVPTEGMRAAMATATVGDEQADEDPTTLALCARVANELGYPAAVFMPSGTMCNLVATLVHTRPGDELIADSESHICTTEAAGAAAIAGVALNPVFTEDGVFTADQCLAAIRFPSRTAPRSAMVSIEQTTNFSGGAIWPLDTLQGVRDAALGAGLKMHIDGARLFNATCATGIPMRNYTEGWDSAWVDFTKGLGCPVGAVLCGSMDFIRDAWTWKYRLGGAMRQSGVLAAAALYALDHHVERLADDHANAQLFVTLLSAEPAFVFTTLKPESNLVIFTLHGLLGDADTFARHAIERGVRIRALPNGRIRATTHLGVTREDIVAAVDILIATARELSVEHVDERSRT
ncbi:threonine aldolase family protein [Caballeronia mineralivorans]|jgi:threonine aldolase|uniref:threonine aldolase family protein n=1 Tax=Caballeronia mineralivorans TaxID=2010198 RepID=UPI0023F07899|nr:threonine aldolase family protein [Caballeronia mineralivorans]MDB5780656.1 threonine aldolase [Caballeronia mineralivorans]MEA3096329.1 threonine aldolase [Caballeronia mineralivorans]